LLFSNTNAKLQIIAKMYCLNIQSLNSFPEHVSLYHERQHHVMAVKALTS